MGLLEGNVEKIKTYIEQFQDNNIYLPTRTIMLSGEIDLDNFRNFFKNIHALDAEKGTINIIINSEGGDLTQCKAIYDVIAGSINLVRGVVYGEASSSASIILQACDERLMTPNSYLMIHYGEESTSGHPLNKEMWDLKHKLDADWMFNVYLKKIKNKKKRYTKEQLKELIIFDKIFTAEEAIKFGLIDVVTDYPFNA